MKAKIFIYAVAVGCILDIAVVAQTLQIKGKVISSSATQIKLQSGPEMKVPCGSGTWIINVTASTTCTPAPTVDSTVVVTCKSPDAQRKEDPNSSPCPSPVTTSSATPTPTPTP